MTENADKLEKVRKLFALAEGASTPEEADAASAQAERLIARYTLDVTMLQEAGEVSKGKPTRVDVKIENPYSVQKAGLVNVIAKAYDVKVVRLMGEKEPTVAMVGFESDIATVQMLYASLILQATTAMLRQPNVDQWGFRRTAGEQRSFRGSFLQGFSLAVNARLKQANAAAVAETPGSALVLRSRADEVEVAVRAEFGKLRTTQARLIGNDGGFDAGGSAGRTANLGRGSVGAGNVRALA